MAYMRDSSGRRLNTIDVADQRRGGSYLGGLAPVTTRLHGANAIVNQSSGISSGTFQQQMTRLAVVVTADATDLRLVFGNYYWGTAGTNDITIAAAIETATPNVSHRVTFGRGSYSVTVAADAAVTSDPVPISVKKGDVLYLRTFVSVASLGQKWPLNITCSQTGEACTEDNDLTSGTGTGTFTAPILSGFYELGFGPSAVLGVVGTDVPVLGADGDSISVGLNDIYSETYRGWIERKVAGQYPLVNVAKHTERVANVVPVPAGGSGGAFSPVSYRHKMRMLGGVTHTISAYGVNDSGDALATIQANLVTRWIELSGPRATKVWQYTLPPTTSSSDQFRTTANQTLSANHATRIALNNWIRDGAPILAGVAVATGSSAPGTLRAGQAGHPLRGYLETADTIESARDSGKWKPAYKSVTDGVCAAGNGTITSATAAFTSVDKGADLVIPGAGAAGAVLVTKVYTVTSATAVVVTPAPSTAVNPATMYWVYTTDGIHPGKAAYTLMGAALDLAVIFVAD